MKTQPCDKLEAGRVRSGPWGSDSRYGLNGSFRIMGPCGRELHIMAGTGDRDIPWEHVSVSLPTRPPNWQEMCFVKELFWTDDEWAMQLHPPKAKNINVHPYCLHLWRPIAAEIPLPPPKAVA